jgi:hypothetical protein
MRRPRAPIDLGTGTAGAVEAAPSWGWLADSVREATDRDRSAAAVPGAELPGLGPGAGLPGDDLFAGDPFFGGTGPDVSPPPAERPSVPAPYRGRLPWRRPAEDEEPSGFRLPGAGR